MIGLTFILTCPACRETIRFNIADMKPEELLTINCPQCNYVIYEETECEEWTYDRT